MCALAQKTTPSPWIPGNREYGLYGPSKWPYKWVTVVITLLTTGRGPPRTKMARFFFLFRTQIALKWIEELAVILHGWDLCFFYRSSTEPFPFGEVFFGGELWNPTIFVATWSWPTIKGLSFGIVCPSKIKSGDSWMYAYQRTPIGHPYISPIVGIYGL